MKADIKLLKTLREETGAGVADTRQALEDADNNYAKAKALIEQRGLKKAEKKEGKDTGQGIVESYIHSNRRVGVLVDLRCETDFVARTDEFKTLAHEIALQVAAMDPKNTEELKKSPYIRDASKTIDSLVKQAIATLGENIQVAGFSRLEIEK